jgi:hypothetical protein
MRTDVSGHARDRLQQRAVPPFVLELLQRFGSSMRCGGAERIFFDKAARRRVKDYLGGSRGLRAVESWLGVYMVLGDNGRVVTVAHQERRFRRP